jgi:hypothetical protein
MDREPLKTVELNAREVVAMRGDRQGAFYEACTCCALYRFLGRRRMGSNRTGRRIAYRFAAKRRSLDLS